jgi:electron transfer flavoprotein alpha subunit
MTILTLIEIREGAIKKSSFEAARAASTLYPDSGAKVISVALGTHAPDLERLGAYGASLVLRVADGRFDNYSTRAFAAALTQIAVQHDASMIFLPATAMGKDLAPALSVMLNAGIAADVTALRVEDGAVIATRPVYAGKALVDLRVNTGVQIFTLRPNVFSAGEADGGVCPVESVSVEVPDGYFAAKATGTVTSSGKLDVAEAGMIVSGGRGMQGPEHWHLIENLAGALGAATGASRAVVDAGWRPHAEQVGQTGKTVSPSLYVACGISGAIQHLAGMSSSKVIVAVNKDKDAPIFQVADYGIIGDVFEVLPALTEELKKYTGR